MRFGGAFAGIGLLLLFIVPAQAQEIWSLERCIGFALENNLQVKQSKLNVELSKSALLRSKGQFLPNVNGSASHFYNFGRTIDPFTNQFAEDWIQSNNFSLNANWTVFNGLQNLSGFQQSKYDLKAQEYALETTQYEISLAITQAYLQILFNLENLRVADSQILLTEDQVTRTRKLFEAGSSPKGDLLDVQAQLANEELNRVDVENQLNLSYLNLVQLLQLPGDFEMRIEVPEDIDTTALRLPQSTENVIQTAYDSYPSIKSAEYSALSAEKGVDLAYGNVSPVLTLSGSLGTGYSGNNTEVTSVERAPDERIGYVQGTNDQVFTESFVATGSQIRPFSDQVDDNLNRSVGVTLQIPIFNGFFNATAIEQAKIQRDIAQTQLEQEKQNVRQDIEQAYADALAAFKRYQSTQRSMESLELAFDYAQKRFDVGLIHAVDYNTAKNSLTRAQADLIRAKYEYIFRLKILDFYQGNPIKL